LKLVDATSQHSNPPIAVDPEVHLHRYPVALTAKIDPECKTLRRVAKAGFEELLFTFLEGFEDEETQESVKEAMAQ